METITEETIAAAYQELALEFVVELMQVTQGATSQTAFQQALQGYVDELCPWLQERDLPETPRDTFSLFVPCEDRESDDDLRGRDRRSSQCLAQELKDDGQSCKGGHHDDDEGDH